MKKAITAALLGLLVAAPALAQAPEIELNPYGGLYLPVGDLAVDEGTEFSQSTAVIFGGRVAVWVTPAFGIEGGFGYALSDVEVVEDGVDQCEAAPDLCDASVWQATARGLYRFSPMPQANWSLHVGAGLGVIGHTGDFWDFLEVDGTTDIGGVLVAGLSVDVTEQIGIRLDIEDFLFSAKFDDPDSGQETDSEFNNDLVFSGGVVFKLGGGGGGM